MCCAAHESRCFFIANIKMRRANTKIGAECATTPAQNPYFHFFQPPFRLFIHPLARIFAHPLHHCFIHTTRFVFPHQITDICFIGSYRIIPCNPNAIRIYISTNALISEKSQLLGDVLDIGRMGGILTIQACWLMSRKLFDELESLTVDFGKSNVILIIFIQKQLKTVSFGRCCNNYKKTVRLVDFHPAAGQNACCGRLDGL